MSSTLQVMALTRRVLDTIQRHALVRQGDRVLVALSGGSGLGCSAATAARTRSRRRARGRGRCTPQPRVARRGCGRRRVLSNAGSERGSRSVRPRLTCVRARRAWGRPSKTPARQARYEFFERVATELGADVIATGHTRDDQAETFLLRLLRGAGPRGLAGIIQRRARVVRPRLEIPRDEFRAYLFRARPIVSRGREQSRPQHSAEQDQARTLAAPVPRLFARNHRCPGP